MRINSVSHPITAIIALAMLGACSGRAPQMAPMTAQENIGATTLSVQRQGLRGGPNSPSVQKLQATEAAGRPLVFVSDYTNNVVDIYLQRRKSKMVGQITGLNSPAGLATDTAGDLYVANEFSATVPVYAPSYTKKPKLILEDGANLPGYVAVSPKGVVGVVNACTAPSCNAYSDSVSFFARNSTKPCVTVAANPAIFQDLIAGAFDDKGNFYIDGFNSQFAAAFGKIVGECKAKTVETLTTGKDVDFVESIQIDRADRIAILDGTAHTIDTYDAPKKGVLGNPVSTTPLAGGPSTAPFAFAFLASGRDLYAAFYGSSSEPGAALKYDYPAGGTPEKALPLPASATPSGLAVTPPLIP